MLCSIRYRNEHTNQDVYPRCSNEVITFSIHEKEFNNSDCNLNLTDNILYIKNGKPIDIQCQCKKYRSYTTGIEDARIWNKHYITGVSLYTNNHWTPEMVLCKYNHDTNTISKIVRLSVENNEIKPQKNWLIINELKERITMIHSYKPFKVITADKEDGISKELFVQIYPELHKIDGEIHGGACLYLYNLNKYIVLVRVIKKHKYQHSLWIILNEDYSIEKISKPFIFMGRKEYELKTYNKGFWYETCMCLMPKNNDEIYASLTISDCFNFIITLTFQDIDNCF
jgi:hypothetical protein